MAPIVGLVGKANVGKSTFFAAATLKPAEIAGFPFTTIKADRGIAYLTSNCVCKDLDVEDNPDVLGVKVDGFPLPPTPTRDNDPQLVAEIRKIPVSPIDKPLQPRQFTKDQPLVSE